MASVWCGASAVDYSLADGRVREFELEGDVLYSEEKNIAVEGWKETMWRWVLVNRGFHCYEDQHDVWSKPMFVEWLDREVNGPRVETGE